MKNSPSPFKLTGHFAKYLPAKRCSLQGQSESKFWLYFYWFCCDLGPRGCAVRCCFSCWDKKSTYCAFTVVKLSKACAQRYAKQLEWEKNEEGAQVTMLDSMSTRFCLALSNLLDYFWKHSFRIYLPLWMKKKSNKNFVKKIKGVRCYVRKE